MIFRRRPDRSEDPNEVEELDEAEEQEVREVEALPIARPRGPWDRDETALDEEEDGYIDLGGLVVKGLEGLELRLQVEDQQGSIASVMFAGPDSGLELRAFAAPRSDGIWDEVRADIAAETVRRGGTVAESDGEFGTELRQVVPVQTPDGKQATQASRVVGVEGPRWLLRGTFFGKSAVDPDPEGLLEGVLRYVIVVRGNEPMAPREMIPMQMPAQAQAELANQVDTPDTAGEEPE